MAFFSNCVCPAQIIIATVVSWQVNLKEKYGVEVVGLIPSG